MDSTKNSRDSEVAESRQSVYKMQQSQAINPIMQNPQLNKGRAFSIKERQLLGIHGLLPPSVLSQGEQVFVAMQNFYRWDNDLDRYIYLMGLLERNEKLFYRLVQENLELMMPVIYTPTVGLACQKYGLIFRKPRGLFITINDLGHVYDIICNWPEHDIKATVVTDGERILGLGDLGCYGMGIPVGKLALYTACAGVRPHQTLPVILDVGTNNETLLKDPLYIGLRQKRVSGPKYDALIEEFFQAIVKRYGQHTLIQFEDFGNQNAFRLLAAYRDRFCTFNDDIQGTASVSVAGLIASMKITNKELSDNTFLFQGAGEAAIGIAGLLVEAMLNQGISETDALAKIWMVDSKGLIVKDRPSGGITEHKARFAQICEPIATLGEVVKKIRPTAIIGVAAIPGAFTEEIIQDMAEFNEKPIIFALSNPTSKAECTAETAYRITKGKCVFASGSPFKPVTVDGTTFYPGQGNNAYIFPGVALAVIACKIRHIPEVIFLKAAESLAEQVSKEDLDKGRVYPDLNNILEVSLKIAIDLAHFVYKQGLAATYPEPQDKEDFIRSQLYTTEYDSFVPDLYDWPQQSVQCTYEAGNVVCRRVPTNK